jgi:hypothetical protein
VTEEALADHLERVRKAARKITEDQRERDDAIIAAVKSGVPQADVARAADITRQRVGQIVQGIPAGPERALLTPEPGSTLTIAVVQKQAADSGRPSLATTTVAAFDALKSAGASLGINAGKEEIPEPGVVDLNRSNLAVLIGPRISALVAQALSADPVIRWERDSRGQWYITDTKAGTEYHSDFDKGWHGAPGCERVCFAHVGRIRRPDGHGTFLYLGGAHSPGTAGAVAYFIREMPEIWDRVRRSPLWSAVVRTVADDSGTPVSSGLATEIYTHGRV